MKSRLVPLVLVLLALLMVPAVSRAQGLGSGCDLSGTWYGGSDPTTPYQLTIVPIGAGRYSMTAQQAIDVRAVGGAALTDWSGEARKNGQVYDWFAMMYFVAPGETPALPELDVVHSTIEFTDCNTFTNRVTVYGAYFAFDPAERTPFVSPFDFDIMAFLFENFGITEIVETYHRLPIGVTPPASPALDVKGRFARGRLPKK